MPAQMSRRELIAWLAAGAGAATAGGVVLLNGSSPTASAPRTTAARPVTSDPTTTPRTVAVDVPQPATPVDGLPMLVIIEMAGGNDGLSTAVPYGQGAYYDLRDQTAIAASDVLTIDDEIGLHPNLVNLHRRGVTLVEGVGSLQPDGSHFEMMARWWAGNSTSADSATGWVGRLADVLDDGSTPASALSIGSGAHPIVRSAKGSALSLSSADTVWAVTGADEEDLARVAYQRALHRYTEGAGTGGGGLGQMRTTLAETLDFAERLAAGIDPEGEQADTRREQLGYTYSGLSDALMFAANVLGGDTGIRVLHIPMDGEFDTHENHATIHPEMMDDLDTSLEAFHTDLAARGIDQRVMVMTTSEFGRTANENGSGGLDHGTASTMLLSGPGTGGRVGQMSSLTDLDENEDFKANLPFESYLAGVVEGWLGVPASEVFGEVEPLPLF